MSTPLQRQAHRLFEVFSELMRCCQLRDREEICCHGISVSQCYTLDLLEREGAMAMGALAGRLQLEISTMTRVVDSLVADKLVGRVPDEHDRRVRRVKISAKGRTLVSRIRAELIAEHEAVLRSVAPASRDEVIDALTRLLEGFEARRCCSTKSASGTHSSK